MKTLAKQFFFGTTLSQHKATNIIWLLFRLHIGLTIALKAGLPKMQEGLAPEWFVKQVGEIGFTFISPTFWATVASWGEFIGGLGIAFGLLTRFNAIQLAFQFFVISFIWYGSPEPITGMYFQNTLFMAYLLTAFVGGGTFSLDYIINKKLSLQHKLKLKPALTVFAVMFIGTSCVAQKGPLKGSGTVVTKTYNVSNFTSVKIKDIADAKVNITAGKAFKVTAKVDDNLVENFIVEQKDNVLHIQIANNRENRLYIEDTKIEVEIELPVLEYFYHSSNSNVTIKGIDNELFEIKNTGNGSVTLFGKTKRLEVVCASNGNINATQLLTEDANAVARGNGNIYINAEKISTGKTSGNGNIINSNKDANAIANDEAKTAAINTNKVKLTIVNKSNHWKEYKVKYPVKGSYGITVEDNSSLVEYFPEGTKLYNNKGLKVFKKLKYTVTKEKEQVWEVK